MIVSEMRLPKEFVFLISISIRKQIKDYVFNVFNEFSKIFMNIKEDLYDANKKEIKEKQAYIFTTITSGKPKYDKKDNELKSFVPFLFDVKFEKALGPLRRRKIYRNNKLVKPRFLRNLSKMNKRCSNNSHILSCENNNIVISKKVMKYYVNYDRIIIEKSRLNLN
jgi:hypothetical protein